ncbi:ATPase [Halovenus sp. WSH3]|uniref:ATPase n=1 Tax=Halovenus carboxidivorans TaxID=2692199 RepID=A0A6B0SYR3_9EURY|nr:ATPase [Halovenus carboxidivorans]MXR50525.1 ATPase [Halovenus carboxidivorans]
MTLLVVGSERVDAGKTTFSTGLVARTRAVGFKPRAGNDYWFHHDDYRSAIERGTLHGKDAARLAAASPGSLDPTDINPVHRLWQPTHDGGGLLGQEGREFLIDRAGEQYVCNGSAALPESAREHLPLSDSVVVEDVGEFNRVMERAHIPALEALRRTIETTDRAVVESYSDIARPIRGIEPDGVAVVEPRRVRIYDGPRFVKACSVASGTEGSFHGQLEERVSSVTGLADPVETASLPPLTSEQRRDPDTVATEYGDAYDALLAVADGW